MNAALASAIAASIVLAFTACGDFARRESLPPVGQVLLRIDTDAWVPLGPGEPADDADAAPLFQKLKVEFFEPGSDDSCADCTREFAIDRRTLMNKQASVGFLPRVGRTGYRVRVRLMRGGGAGEVWSDLHPDSTIESNVVLPAVAEEGVREVAVILRTDDVGRPRGSLQDPIAPEAALPEKSLVGSWHAEVRQTCRGRARPEEVCVRGGAYWMGDPSFDHPWPERLVVVSPFFMDRTETTVGQFRALDLAVRDVTAPDPIPVTRAVSCTYTDREGDSENRALNCITRPLAEKACAKRGGTLPSEAQYEFAAGAFRGFAFPWGTDLPSCEGAVFARNNKNDPNFPDASFQPSRDCNSFGMAVAAPGTGLRDRVRTDDGEILDLAGNLSEWVRDRFVDSPSKCWDSPALNPVCGEGNDSSWRIRGGNWTSMGGYELAAAFRASVAAQELGGRQFGFRCVRDDD